MQLVTTSQMKNIEDYAINTLGISSIILMENAARSVTQQCTEYKNITIFAGKGNNGGDGLAVARQLVALDHSVTVIFIGDTFKATPDCSLNLNILKKMDVPIIYYTDQDLIPLISSSDLIIDAIIGTGLIDNLREPIFNIVNTINTYSKYTIAIDCPTGINSDTGAICGNAVYAHKTITFHAPKIGLMLYPAYERIGELIISDISIPHNTDTGYNLLTPKEAKILLPVRPQYANKGTFGKSYIFAGCEHMTGACVISATSAYRVGSGLVNGCVVKSVADVLHNLLPEAVTTILPDINGYLCSDSFDVISPQLSKANAIALGSGIGVTNDTKEFVGKLLTAVSCPIVIDADGLNCIADNIDLLKEVNSDVIITPHLGEMSRLTNLTVSYISSNLIDTAKHFAHEYNVTVVLKDTHTIIANPDGEIYINTAGNSSMSKGGTGDCLTGIITGLISQGLSPYYSAVLGTYVNGLTGELASDKLSKYSVFASDILNQLHQTIVYLLSIK